jgi:RHS repeat-associated protein
MDYTPVGLSHRGPNILGSTSLTTDETGAPISEVRYLPYGEERWTSGATPTDFTFTGQRNEAGFGLMDYNARYYSARLGRFISPDTIVPEPINSQGFNRYSYANNNPVRFTDPSGHCGPVCWTFIALAVGYGAYEYLANPDIAKAPGPVDVMIDNPPQPSDLPGNDEALCSYCVDAKNGNLGMAALGVGIEATPLDEIPGVNRIVKGMGSKVSNAVSDFVNRAGVTQGSRGYRTFGATWNVYAQMVDAGQLSGSLFTSSDEAGNVMGAMHTYGTAHAATGALQISALEGLGGGAGTSLFKQAVRESQQNSQFNGGIYLESTNEALDWYITNLKPTKVDGHSLYWSPEDAAKLLE